MHMPIEDNIHTRLCRVVDIPTQKVGSQIARNPTASVIVKPWQPFIILQIIDFDYHFPTFFEIFNKLRIMHHSEEYRLHLKSVNYSWFKTISKKCQLPVMIWYKTIDILSVSSFDIGPHPRSIDCPW